MHRSIRWPLLPALVLFSLFTPDAECGIWLCLLTGFITGCDATYDAFKKRIKPPLPPFHECLVNTNHDTFTRHSAANFRIKTM
ncbi:hypothetical protein [Vibrio metoecus]|uniref:hypothetical protein n=1 Tax=Vibrio metoecus TaxID=1481663 RepID=UPI00103B7DE3|nr:hypothetical protein [Vibrio metoecus]